MFADYVRIDFGSRYALFNHSGYSTLRSARETGKKREPLKATLRFSKKSRNNHPEEMVAVKYFLAAGM